MNFGTQGLIFCQRFVCPEYSMCAEDVSVSPRTGLLGWFLGPRVLVFVNGFWGSSSVCRVKISASVIEVRFEDDVWDTMGLSFLQRFVFQELSMCVETVSVSRRTRLLGWFLNPRVLVFVNGFWASSSLCTLKISASAVELRFEDDFWDTRDSVFFNGLSFRSSLCA